MEGETLKQLEFELKRGEAGKYRVSEDGEKLPKPYSSYTLAERRASREFHKAFKGIEHYKIIYVPIYHRIEEEDNGR